MQKTCAAFHDLSCYAKSSLTIVLPVLEVMGIEECPVPTALLSSQTDGFDSYYFEDTTLALTSILKAWDELALSFDALYSGFLGSDDQVAIFQAFITRQRERSSPLVLVDPVLGDAQELYGPITQAHVVAMRSLVCCADVITPNVTEAALLLETKYKESFSESEALHWARKLTLQTGAMVAITGVALSNGYAVACCDKNDVFLVPFKMIDASFPGTGDLFSSILLGNLLCKQSFQNAIINAVEKTSAAISRTLDSGHERRHGVSSTLILKDLALGAMADAN